MPRISISARFGSRFEFVKVTRTYRGNRAGIEDIVANRISAHRLRAIDSRDPRLLIFGGLDDEPMVLR